MQACRINKSVDVACTNSDLMYIYGHDKFMHTTCKHNEPWTCDLECLERNPCG